MIMLDSASLLTVLTHAVIIGFAALVHGTIGIGFPLIATPLLALITDVRTAILLLVLPTVVVNMANILRGGRSNLSPAVYWPLAVYGMIGSLIGTRMLIVFSPDPFLPLMAAMLVIYLNAERLGAGFAWVPPPSPHRLCRLRSDCRHSCRHGECHAAGPDHLCPGNAHV
jgi:hypothetical protein